jgi:uncharacterized damage-inducible protein DinB
MESSQHITTELDTVIGQVIAAWSAQNKQLDKFLSKFDDAAFQKEVAPGRNRPVYLLGHLIAVNDGMITLFGLGEKLYPELQEPFFAPDNKNADYPPVSELKQKWSALNAHLTDKFSKMSSTEWLDRHTSVSEEDFKSNPQRNKLNVLISRTNHQSYHLGQMNLLNA